MHQQLILDISPAPQPALNNYVVGTNQQALAALRECSPGRAIYLWGPQGVGRTHLLKAMATAHNGLYFSAFTPSAQLLRRAQDDTPMPALLAGGDGELLHTSGQRGRSDSYSQWRG